VRAFFVGLVGEATHLLKNRDHVPVHPDFHKACWRYENDPGKFKSLDRNNTNIVFT
jgi:hypothetical protein